MESTWQQSNSEGGLSLNELPGIQREQFILQLGKSVAQAHTDQTHLGLLLIDLTNLSRINHFHGYDAGDQLLHMAYHQLLGLSKLPNAVYRLGSHRFSFILPDLGNPAFIALAMNRVHRSLEAKLLEDATALGVDVKIGIAINRLGVRDFMATLAQAEASLSHVKLGGIQRIEDVLAEDNGQPLRRRVEQSLAEALQDNAFELYYQPKVDLASGELHGAEALLRWQSPEGEFITPDLIVEWAESAGRTYDLTKWVVHKTLRQLREWQDTLDIGLALNIPATLAGDPDLPSLLQDAIAIWGVDPARVTVELTESAFIKDKQSGYDNLLKLCELGVNISIDDFGTGYSSLSYFKHIPATELKIDKSFIDSMLVDTQDMELVKIIIHIAHQFGLTVVAEGVEDLESLHSLRELGCDRAQGYYLARPLPVAEFETWAENWKGFPLLNRYP
jgi:diguanylate cyclase (GGDEF)-like protein